jgi:hypothetical protein
MKKERMLSALSRDAPVIRPLWRRERKEKKDLMKYLLLFCATPEELAVWQTLSEEARAQTRAKSAQWMSEHREKIRSDHGLHLPHTVTSVYVGAGGQPLVTDGPFLEGTEVIGGYAVIEVADLDEALQLATRWPDHGPGHRVVEIWPIVEE